MRTYTPTAGDQATTRKWHVIDAEGVVLGRLASHAAALLRGKHKTTFAPHMDMGDFVVIINAEKVALTGQKAKQKFDHHHSGFPGCMTSVVYADLINEDPTRVVEEAILGMIPKNKIGRSIGTKLKVYAGPTHPHAAQNPSVYEITQISQVKK